MGESMGDGRGTYPTNRDLAYSILTRKISTNQIAIPSPPMAYSLLLNNNFHEITRHKTSLIAKVIATVSEKVRWSKSVLVKVPLPGKKNNSHWQNLCPLLTGGRG